MLYNRSVYDISVGRSGLYGQCYLSRTYLLYLSISRGNADFSRGLSDTPAFIHYCSPNRWKTQLPPVPPLQMGLYNQCLHWSSRSLSFVYWVSVLLAVRYDAGQMLFFCISRWLCDSTPKLSESPSSLGPNGRLDPIFFWFVADFMIQSIDKRNWRDARAGIPASPLSLPQTSLSTALHKPLCKTIPHILRVLIRRPSGILRGKKRWKVKDYYKADTTWYT